MGSRHKLISLIPIVRLYRWLQATTREPVNIFRFCEALPKHSRGRHITPGGAISCVRNSCAPEPVTYFCSLPAPLYERWSQSVKRTKGLKIKDEMGKTVQAQLRRINGGVHIEYLTVDSYRGLRVLARLALTNHDVVSIKILARGLRLPEWQVVTLLLDGTMVNWSDVVSK